MNKGIWVLNGPNLNMLGEREPEIYGHSSLSEIEMNCRLLCEKAGVDLDFRQTNHEGVLVDWVQQATFHAKGLVINAAAYTHTSIALHDALENIKIPSIEVHLTNIYKREPFRQVSFISPCVHAIVAGFSEKGYTIALQFLIDQIG